MRNKNILILGGSSDIGIETINLFLKNNWNVTSHYNKNKISIKKLIKTNKRFFQFKFDLKNINKLEKYIKLNKSKFNKFDAFVNLTGYFKKSNFENFSVKDLYDHFNVNCISGLLFTRQLIPYMKKNNWGRIVNTTSIGTKFGGGLNSFLYSLSKFNNQFFPQYYKKIYSKNIIINTLQIGLTKTKLLKKLPNKNYNKRIKLIPINRMAKPIEVANYIHYLCSEQNTLLTGTIFNISGGE